VLEPWYLLTNGKARRSIFDKGPRHDVGFAICACSSHSITQVCLMPKIGSFLEVSDSIGEFVRKLQQSNLVLEVAVASMSATIKPKEPHEPLPEEIA
jgi:hypothetical protein